MQTPLGNSSYPIFILFFPPISFFDQFQAQVGNRDDLEPVIKLQYLKSQLRGKAHELIKDILSISDNYQYAVTSLKETYGDEERVKRGILTKILELASPSYIKQELESFRISLINLTRSLENKHDFSSDEWIIAFMFQRKLSKTTIHQLYLKYTTNFFSLKEMKDGLGDLIAHMDVESNKVDKRVKPASSQLSTARNTTDSDIGSYLSYKETEQPSVKRKVNTTNKILLCV